MYQYKHHYHKYIQSEPEQVSEHQVEETKVWKLGPTNNSGLCTPPWVLWKLLNLLGHLLWAAAHVRWLT